MVSQHITQNPSTEKRFRVNLHKNVAMQAMTSSRQADRAPLKSSARKLLQTQQFSLSQSTLQKTQPARMVEKQPFVPVSPRTLKAQTLPEYPFQHTTPAIKEFVVAARELPTPIPTPASTPVPTKQPTPIPTQIPTKIPETKKPIQPVKTPDIPTPTATIPPVSSPTVAAKSTASPELEFTPTSLPTSRGNTTTTAKSSSQNENAEPNAIKKSESKDNGGAKEQQQKELLKRYLQEVAAQIHAQKSYPRQARRKGWEGTVVIKVSILSTGEVEQAVLVTSSEHKVLDEAAFQAIAKAQPFPRFYEELTLQSITLNIPVQFTLDK